MKDSLHGNWRPIRAEHDGEDAPAIALEKIDLVLTPECYEVRFASLVHDRGTVTMTQTSLILTGQHGENDGRVIPAIYQLQGDRLRICYGIDGTAPEEFKTAVGSGRYLVIYRRNNA